MEMLINHKLNKWEFVQDEKGYLKKIFCDGHEIMATSISIEYEPIYKRACITIDAYDFCISVDSSGEKLTGRKE